MKITGKVKAGTLVVTIVIAFILSILCSAIILIGYYNRFDQQNFAITQTLISHEESAINLVLADTSFFSDQEASVSLFSEGNDSVNIKKGPWGIFRYAYIKGRQRRFTREAGFLYGPDLPEYMNACLYMADHQRPLALVGNTRLTGNAYLSNAGVKAAYIDQRGYSNTKLVEGDIKKSRQNLPELDTNILKYLAGLTSQAADTNQHTTSFNLVPGSVYAQSFSEEALVFSQQGKLSLAGSSLTGHIILFSDTEIEVAESMTLENIILVAPVIRFKSKFKGTIQAFATDSLIMEAEVNLHYPSAVVLLKNKDYTTQNTLRIAERCVVNGIVITRADEKDLFRTYIDIARDAGIRGIIYTMGYLSLKGWVEGVVLTDYFIYKNPSPIYENYLVDVTINRDKLSDYFTEPSVFSNSGRQKIITWVK